MTEQETKETQLKKNKEFELFELLRYVGGVRSTHWNTVLDLIGYINKNEAIIESKKWQDKHKEENPDYYPLNLSQVSTWSTFDGECIDLKFNAIDDKLYCEVKIYDGESFGGRRKELRFGATLTLPFSFLISLETRIDYAFSQYLDYAYEQHLLDTKKLWIYNFKNEVMIGVNNAINSKIK